MYADTKIRLHFSHFRHLDDDKDTCFLDEPNKCSDISEDYNEDLNGNFKIELPNQTSPQSNEL